MVDDNFGILALRVETNPTRDPRGVKIVKDERESVSSLSFSDKYMQKPQRLSARATL